MNKEQYNKLQILYVSLINRYHYYRDYRFDDIYKCYNKESFFVKNIIDDILQEFSNLSLSDIYSENKKKELVEFYPNNYMEKKLVLLKEIEVGFIPDFQIILLDYIFYRLKDELQKFIEIVEELKESSRYKTCIIATEDKVTFKFDDVFHNWIKEICKDDKINMLVHFFQQTRGYIELSLSGKFIIDVSKLNRALKRVENDYDFSKISNI